MLVHFHVGPEFLCSMHCGFIVVRLLKHRFTSVLLPCVTSFLAFVRPTEESFLAKTHALAKVYGLSCVRNNSKPDYHSSGSARAEDIFHLLDLLVSFQDITLVDGDGIYPHDTLLIDMSQVSQSYSQISRYIESLVIDKDG